nr:helix-turn-helix transcriptional regulator [Streptomyces violaceusniger]
MADGESEDGEIVVTLDEVLKQRGMSLGELSRQTGITDKNLGELKNGKKKAVWWSTLAAVCRVLDCQPGDLIVYRPVAAKSAPAQESASEE